MKNLSHIKIATILCLQFIFVGSFSYGAILTHTISGKFLHSETRQSVWVIFQISSQETGTQNIESKNDKGFKIKGLESGIYEISYENQYKQRFDTLIEVKSKNIKDLVIWYREFDYSQDPTNMFVEELRIGDSISYGYRVVGTCEYQAPWQLIVSKEIENYRIDYYQNENWLKGLVITSSELLPLIKFEEKFRRVFYLHRNIYSDCGPIALGTEFYSIDFGKEPIEVQISSCFGTWGEFHRTVKQLFKTEN